MKKYTLFIAGAMLATLSFAQSKKSGEVTGWYFSKPSKKNMGISVDEAYKTDQAKLPSTTVLVAVIDGGTDVNHEDLKDVIWTNSKEVPNNGIDDDHNGYIDDIHGWNFIGGKDGSMVGADNLEKVRIYKKLSLKYKDANPDQQIGNAEYEMYKSMSEDIEAERARFQMTLASFKPVVEAFKNIRKACGKENPTADEVKNCVSSDKVVNAIKDKVAQAMKNKSFTDLFEEVKEQLNYFETKASFQNNPDYDSRTIVGDNYANSSERYYGNNNVVGPDASHGTHVAGIIAGVRNNGVGMNGVADNVRIMVVRVVPDGDERDKDVANGIRYAVDNGAKIINMSFGKAYRWDKNIVDSAVAYAESKGVLLVHAAGNDSKNNDVEPNYPNDSLWSGKSFASNWIEIGASQPKRKMLATSFSNYGKHNVDVFSPGQDIYSTIPGNKYANFNGTSMAAPVAAGVAALVWSRFPNLTAVQVKSILMNSSVKVHKKVILPGSKKTKIAFDELSVSGGLINAKAALEMAATIK